MLLPKFLSRKISPEKSLDFLSRKSVLRPASGKVKKVKKGGKRDWLKSVELWSDPLWRAADSGAEAAVKPLRLPRAQLLFAILMSFSL